MRIDELVIKMQELKNQVEKVIQGEQIDGIELSKIGLQLSIYQVSLGDEVTRLDSQINELKTLAKNSEIDTYLEERKLTTTAKDSEMKAKQCAMSLIKQADTIGATYGKLKMYYENIKGVIMNIQTMLGYMKSDRLNNTIEAK